MLKLQGEKTAIPKTIWLHMLQYYKYNYSCTDHQKFIIMTLHMHAVIAVVLGSDEAVSCYEAVSCLKLWVVMKLWVEHHNLEGKHDIYKYTKQRKLRGSATTLIGDIYTQRKLVHIAKQTCWKI